MQIVSKDIENGKKIKVMHMNTLHDRFPDFDFGEDAREDYNVFIAIELLNFLGKTLKWLYVIILRSSPDRCLGKKVF